MQGGFQLQSIRRKDREISTEDAIKLLAGGEYGILSTVGSEGQPYGVPMSYAYKDGRIYFHCALEGRKLDNIADNPNVSFSVVGTTKILPDRFGTEYESAIAFGVASEIFGEERYAALVMLLEKYCREFIDEGKCYIAAKDAVTRVFKIDINHVTGKARR